VLVMLRGTRAISAGRSVRITNLASSIEMGSALGGLAAFVLTSDAALSVRNARASGTCHRSFASVAYSSVYRRSFSDPAVFPGSC